MFSVASAWLIGVALFAGAQMAQSDVLPRVYNGEDDTDHRYPHVIAFIIKTPSISVRFCSGTLIAASWVLTAAHCGIHVHINTTLVQYGNMTVAPAHATTTSKIHTVFIHPGFSIIFERIYNDIALVQIDRVPIKQFGSISAVDYRSLTGLAIEYAGYGITYLINAKNRKVLTELDQTKPLQIGRGVIRTCDGDKNNRLPFLCVAPSCVKRDQNNNPGDSGSSMFYNKKIIAVLTGGDVLPPFSMYTAVSPYIDWIHGIMNKYKHE